MRRFAFTLAELLIALSIVGVIAVLTVPGVTRNFFAKSNIVKLEATIKILNDAVKNMMIEERVTDTADSSLLLDTGVFFTEYLKISRQCDDDPTVCFAGSYKNIEGDDIEPFKKDVNNDDAMLPSGAVIQFCTKDSLSSFIIDVNGIEPPNVIGRDVFSVDVYSDGTVATRNHAFEDDTDVVSACRNSGDNTFDFYGSVCLSILESNGWVMDY